MKSRAKVFVCRYAVLAAFFVVFCAVRPAKADTLNYFSFTGQVTSENYYPYPAALTSAGVHVGDTVVVTFATDSTTAGYQDYYDMSNAVTDVKVVDTTAGYTIADLGSQFLSLETYATSYEASAYRWDTSLPGSSGYEMTWWFRTTNESNVTRQQVPTSINASDFDYLHNFDIYYANGQNPAVLDVELSNTPAVAATPEPSSLSLMLLGLGGVLTGARRRFGQRNRQA
jgi:hypothetical protein